MYKTAVFVFFIISVSLMLAALFILSICGCWELYRKFNTSSINPEEIEEAGKQQQIKRKHISISTQKFISVMLGPGVVKKIRVSLDCQSRNDPLDSWSVCVSFLLPLNCLRWEG